MSLHADLNDESVSSVPLENVLEFKNDIVHPKDNPRGSALFVGLEHIERDTGIRLGSRQINLSELTGRRARFEQGDIVYGYLRPYLNKVWTAEFSGFCSVDQYVLRVKSSADPSYVAHYLRSGRFLSLAPVGSTPGQLPRIRSGEIAATPIPLPQLDEQRRIAAILDKADALRRKRKRALDLLGGLTQSIFLEMFGDPATNPNHYPVCTLREISRKISDGPFGSNLKSSHYVEEGVRVIRLQNIGVGKFIDDDATYISDQHFSQLSRHECLPGDVLVGTLGDPNLRACIQPRRLEMALNKADCVQVRVDPKKAKAEYVCALLNQPAVERMAQSLMLGQTRTRISMGRLRDMPLPIAPIEKQAKFVAAIARSASIQSGFERNDAEQRALFASLQSRAFSGQL